MPPTSSASSPAADPLTINLATNQEPCPAGQADTAYREIGIMDVMPRLNTISVTTEQHEQLEELANSEGITMRELIDRFLRRERRRRIGQMLTETNANRTGGERRFEAAVAAAGTGTVRDALR